MDHLVKKVFQRRLIKNFGVDIETVGDKEDLLLENIYKDQKIAGLEEEVGQLKTTRLKRGSKKLISQILKDYPFPKTQRKLLRFLGDCKPKKVSAIKQATGTKSDASLLRDTNKRIKKYGGSTLLRIKSCKDQKITGFYRLLISASRN